MILFLIFLLLFQETFPMSGFRYKNVESSSLKDLCIPIVIKHLQTFTLDTSKIPADVKDQLAAYLKRKHATLFYSIFKDTFQPQITLQPDPKTTEEIVFLNNCRLCLKRTEQGANSILWNVEHNMPVLTFEQSGTLAMTQDHQYVYHCSSDKVATVYSLKTMDEVASCRFDPYTDVLIFDPAQRTCFSYLCETYDGHCGHCHVFYRKCGCYNADRKGWTNKSDKSQHPLTNYEFGLALKNFYSLIEMAPDTSYILVGRKEIAYFKALLMHEGFARTIFHQKDVLLMPQQSKYFLDFKILRNLKTDGTDYYIEINHQKKCLVFSYIREDFHDIRVYDFETEELIEKDKWEEDWKRYGPPGTSEGVCISDSGNILFSINSYDSAMVFDISKGPEPKTFHCVKAALPWTQKGSHSFSIEHLALNSTESLALLVVLEHIPNILYYYLYNLKSGHFIKIYTTFLAKKSYLVKDIRFNNEGDICIANDLCVEGNQSIVKFDFSKLAPTLSLQQVLFLIELSKKENPQEYVKSADGRTAVDRLLAGVSDEITKASLKKYLAVIESGEEWIS